MTRDCGVRWVSNFVKLREPEGDSEALNTEKGVQKDKRIQRWTELVSGYLAPRSEIGGKSLVAWSGFIPKWPERPHLPTGNPPRVNWWVLGHSSPNSELQHC
jgi:hypothetical protein